MFRNRRFWMFLGLYGVLVTTTLPLVFRLIPPNRWYGFRLPGLLLNPNMWYEINNVGGKLFITAMLVCAVVNLLLFWQGSEALQRYAGWINFGLIFISFWLVSVELLTYLP